ncbi:MAG: BREX-1 system adenine-specific DNA-methyltransferase PglX, partial [Prevotellaceae bacterium]|nr:BREX-1 system adenine-specific DNA-methyltransferase PglX [Prevotellaceae bacterium]
MELETLKAYLNSIYQGWESFRDTIVFPIFGREDFEDAYGAELLRNQPELQRLAAATGIRSVKMVGSIFVGVEPLQIFDVTVGDHVAMERNRVTIQRLIRSLMQQYSCAFMLFHYDQQEQWDWRFSYCHKGGNEEETTDSKRYTFLLGPGQSCRTAAENFLALYGKRGSLDIADIENAFNVEALSKEFFGKYKEHYQRFVDYIRDPANGIRQNFLNTGFDRTGMTQDKANDLEEKPIRDYVKKLLGRIVFLHFLQKKGWLGVPAGQQWGEGDREFMLHLFQYATDEQKDDFLDNVLEPLFSDALDQNRGSVGDVFNTKVDKLTDVRVPYLNGGLFERDEQDKKECRLPAKLFDELLTMLSQYNFTIDENDPNDAEVGVDPEMLGRIFENLLEDNKEKGAYYTPKEIVQYMCRESLIAYLQTGRGEEERNRIRDFVLTHDPEPLAELRQAVCKELTDVKICDPAIGSGAFPMGLLRELFFCRCALDPSLANNPADVKRHIIENNIYGVDIDRGAVDIARLRFWLALIVDEKEPITLPNLDYKIIRGNSLLESFAGYDMANIMEKNGSEQLEFDYDTRNQALVQKQIHYYYKADDHEERQRLRKSISKAVKNLIISNVAGNIEEKIKDIEPTDTDQFFLCHTLFSDVFSREGKKGFDIIIGNPPYIQLENNRGALANLYQIEGYKTFARTGDIYCLFYERGFQLLREGGHLCFITSNKWMRAGYGEKTRKFFAENTNPELLIDFAGVKIFESATVDTNILLFSKADNQHKTLCAVTSKKDKSVITNLSDFVKQHSSVCDFSDGNSWVILSSIEQSIKRKIEAMGTPLKDWDISIYRGVLTGCNEAFIISTEKRNEILANCQSDSERKRTEELIRPILRGRDIQRYSYT